MDVFRRVKKSGVGGGGLSECAGGWARSTRNTVAPKSARSMPAKGPGHVRCVDLIAGYELYSPGARPANSRTRRDVNGGDSAIVEL